ncbi:MAG: septum site-determining protein MinC [Ectothiorhodospiraceae bacterium]
MAEHGAGGGPPLEIKGRMMTLTVIRLLSDSLEALEQALEQRMAEAPAFFRHLPVILDVEAVADSRLSGDLPRLVALLREREFVPVGVRGGGEAWQASAEAAGIGVFEGGSEAAPVRRAEPAPEPAESQPRATSPTTVVTQQVRSGQQIYARGGDLIVLASVSPGAEVLADGHIHVYGSLNGRALAGVQGDDRARIFCMDLHAELVTVAGTYRVNEQLDDALVGEPVQIFLDGDDLRVERLALVGLGRAGA